MCTSRILLWGLLMKHYFLCLVNTHITQPLILNDFQCDVQILDNRSPNLYCTSSITLVFYFNKCQIVFTFNKRDLLIVVILLQNDISLSSSPHYDNYYKNASPGKGGK